MAYDFVVIGATGLQGRIVSRDLLEHGYRVLLCGRDKARVAGLLRHGKQTGFRYVELRDHAQTASVIRSAKAQVVVNCAEGDYNVDVQKMCLALGTHYVDLGSDTGPTAQQFALHDAFRKKKLCALTGCGSVPGIGNVMLRHAAEQLDTVREAQAGFAWAANKDVFVVPYSIITIIEEFTDKPVIVQNGKFRTVLPQSDAQERSFAGIGKQQSFLSWHAEAYTYYRYLKPKGVKSVRFYAGFPKHSYDTIMTFINAGLGSKEFLDGSRPIDYLAQALKGNRPPKGYKETENLWVTVTGTRNGKERTIRMNCIVPTLPGWEEHGCNVDTGLPCAIMARMIKEGVITESGSRSPEFFVPVKQFFREIAKRKMRVHQDGKRIN